MISNDTQTLSHILWPFMGDNNRMYRGYFTFACCAFSMVTTPPVTLAR